jgi:hypothetical protein
VFFVTETAPFGSFYSGHFVDHDQEENMGNLKEIEQRHGRDRWKDALFIAAALLLTAISIGSVTSKAAGSIHRSDWGLAFQETPEILR